MRLWREHEWEDTGVTEQALVNLYRLWRCKRCGFKSMQHNGVKPENFDLSHGHWDCDLQLLKQVMES